MPKTFTLKEGIGAAMNSRAEDVLEAKRAFNRLGFYEPDPELGFNGFVDRGLDTAIRRFQRSRGLLETGEIKPGDDTTKQIAAELRQAPNERMSTGARDTTPESARTLTRRQGGEGGKPESILTSQLTGPQQGFDPGGAGGRSQNEDEQASRSGQSLLSRPGGDTGDKSTDRRRTQPDPCQGEIDVIEEISQRLNRFGLRIREADNQIAILKQTIAELESLRPGDPVPGIGEVPRELPVFVPGPIPRGTSLRAAAASILLSLLGDLARTESKNQQIWEERRQAAVQEAQRELTAAREEKELSTHRFENLEANLRERAKRLEDCRAQHSVSP